MKAGWPRFSYPLHAMLLYLQSGLELESFYCFGPDALLMNDVMPFLEGPRPQAGPVYKGYSRQGITFVALRYRLLAIS